MGQSGWGATAGVRAAIAGGGAVTALHKSPSFSCDPLGKLIVHPCLKSHGWVTIGKVDVFQSLCSACASLFVDWLFRFYLNC